MTYQKWIVLIAFLTLFSFLAEVKSSPTCLEEVVQQLEETLTSVENFTYSALKGDCADLQKSGNPTGISGVYVIRPDDGDPFDVYCDQKTAGGGWTVIQKRLDGSVDFYQSWALYQQGFGIVNGGEFWLGLDNIHRLTKEGRNIIRVDLEDIRGKTAYAEYDMFVVANESAKYELRLGNYSGTAGDSFTHHHGSPFSTKDRDNDPDSRNCAETFKGGWWYNTCHEANLNGLYRHGGHSDNCVGINWLGWNGDQYSAKRAEMKIRPADF